MSPGEGSVRPKVDRHRQFLELNAPYGRGILIGEDRRTGQTFIVVDKVGRETLAAWWNGRLLKRAAGIDP